MLAMLALSLPALAASQPIRGGVTDLLCPSGGAPTEHHRLIDPASPRTQLTPKALERLPVGAVAPGGWLLEQLLLQSNSLAGYLSDSTFPGADHVNKSEWSGGDGSKMGGTYQWLPYWTNGQVILLGSQPPPWERPPPVEVSVA
jgi:hypothetical protein